MSKANNYILNVHIIDLKLGVPVDSVDGLSEVGVHVSRQKQRGGSFNPYRDHVN